MSSGRAWRGLGRYLLYPIFSQASKNVSLRTHGSKCLSAVFETHAFNLSGMRTNFHLQILCGSRSGPGGVLVEEDYSTRLITHLWISLSIRTNSIAARQIPPTTPTSNPHHSWISLSRTKRDSDKMGHMYLQVLWSPNKIHYLYIANMGGHTNRDWLGNMDQVWLMYAHATQR